MKSLELMLWGVDADLPGNHERIQVCLPIVVDGERIFAARDYVWSIDNAESIAELSEEEAQNKATSIDIECVIADGNVVVVVGPMWFEAYKEIDYVEAVTLRGSCYITSNGFHILPTQLSRSRRLLDRVRRYAEVAFDSEVKQSDGQTAGQRMASTLLLLRNTGHGPADKGIVRTLVYYRIAKDADRYRYALELGARRLRVGADQLEHWAQRHFETLVEAKPFSRKTQKVRQVLAESRPEFFQHKLQDLMPDLWSLATQTSEFPIVQLLPSPGSQLLEPTTGLGLPIKRKTYPGSFQRVPIARQVPVKGQSDD